MLVLNFFTDLYDKVNGWFKTTFKFDEILWGLYDKFIVPIPEIVKILGSIFLLLLLVLGAIAFIKKFIKASIVIGIIIAIIVIFVILK
ncbi:MAG: hypothetical protein ACOX56_06660 [Acholeplasmataceae bacterium]|jgi:Ca2+/Na+ antiporter